MTSKNIYLLIRSLKNLDWLGLRTILRLSTGSYCVTDLYVFNRVEQSSQSAVLSLFRKFGLVSTSRNGKEIIYTLNEARKSDLFMYCLKMAGVKVVNAGNPKKIKEAILKTEHILAGLNKSTSPDNIRLKMYEMSKGGITVSEARANFPSVSQPTITNQLNFLEKGGWIRSKKNGRGVVKTANIALAKRREQWTNDLIWSFENAPYTHRFHFRVNEETQPEHIDAYMGEKVATIVTAPGYLLGKTVEIERLKKGEPFLYSNQNGETVLSDLILQGISTPLPTSLHE